MHVCGLAKGLYPIYVVFAKDFGSSGMARVEADICEGSINTLYWQLWTKKLSIEKKKRN